MSAPPEETAQARRVIDDLPGDLMIWVLIVSELLVFGAGLLGFLGARIADPDGFGAAAAQLHPVRAGIGTMVLVTSGALAAIGTLRGGRWLLAAAALGAVFIGIKWAEWSNLVAAGIDTETHVFFTLYYLLTGFHAAHVAAGILLLGLVAWRARARETEAAVAFWHMVDLVWVLLYPVIYLVAST
ncbi:MAG: cytochrome c oxidase subunit 3 [Maritimibacter sp.]|nr:cytochrome c oxidase subunit 3 [Maritimibacter sp.]